MSGYCASVAPPTTMETTVFYSKELINLHKDTYQPVSRTYVCVVKYNSAYAVKNCVILGFLECMRKLGHVIVRICPL